MRQGATGEWRRGWHLAALAATALVCAPTTVAPYSIGLFVAPLQEAYGWSRSAIQGAIMFSTGLGLAGGPLAGWLVRRLGLRAAILSGVVGIAAALCCAASIQGALWQFYLAYALIALLGAGASAVTWTCLISERFSHSRGLALGFALSGTGISAMVTPRLAELGMHYGGWRAAYLALGGLIPNLVPALTDRGLPQGDAVTVMGVLGATIIAGRIVVGWLIDRIWAPAIAAIILVPAAIGCMSLMSDSSFAGYAAAAGMLGLATGMEFDMLAFLTARYFGLVDYPRICGRLHMFVAAAAGGGPLAYGAMYDRLHSYQAAFTLSACLLIAGAACMLGLGRYPQTGVEETK